MGDKVQVINSKNMAYFLISQNILYIFVYKILSMKHVKTFLLIALLALSIPVANAQRGRARAKKTSAAAVETPAQKLFNTMLPATAKVMFIDSIVVGKDEFVSKIPLVDAAGKLSAKRSDSKTMLLGQYENDFADRRLCAVGDTAGTSLHDQVLLGDGWSNPTRTNGIDEDDYPFQNFPFLCTDGVTLFFSAKGDNSIGGYDIFMTTYDSDKGEWYEPQNYGLPYNSTANDYLLAIDDLDSLGWLVSDRYQPEDSVCIYTFVPTYPRLDLTSEDLTHAQLEHYAKLTAISDTWEFGNRQEALARRKRMLANATAKQDNKTMAFVINDGHVARSLSDIRTEAGRNLYKQLQELHTLQQATQARLNTLRQTYAAAEMSKKKTMTGEILQLEKDLLQQNADVKLLEKKIRKHELMP